MSNYLCRHCGRIASKEPCQFCGRHDYEQERRKSLMLLLVIAGSLLAIAFALVNTFVK